MKDNSINQECVKALRERLDNINVSDYHGLESPGLTCYLNSILQVFFMTEDFRRAVNRCYSKEHTTMDGLLYTLFSDLERSLATTHQVTTTLGIVDVLEQRDAAEYFERILYLTSPEASKIFKGELQHKITCLTCKKWNHTRNYFWILPLAVKKSSPHTYSVDRGLRSFFREETVCGENKMYCNHCSSKKDAIIGCAVTQQPQILTLLLKRFTFDYRSSCFVKLHCSVDIPATLLMGNRRYQLYALVHHYGSLTGGHYTSQVQSFETGEWYCFNDNIVEKVQKPLFDCEKATLRSESAYLLMYRADRTFSEDAGEGEGPGAALDLKDVFGGSGDPSAEVDTELQTEGDLDHMDVDRPRQRSVYEEHVDNSAPVQNHLSAQDRLKPSDVCWDMMCTDKNDRQQMTDGTSKCQSKSQIQAEKNLQGAKSKGSPPSNGLTKCHLSPSLHRKPKANGEKLLPAMTASERRRHHRKEKSKVKPWK
ncbi:ubiquitin carboxyl-terminal hydrolase 47 isoform X2 [Cynoglossus semilaevis]|uniref:Ubiquitin carboxyl-terminal hydrolase 47-like n=1 Tax=Cynoglossus semilaevis TaxID=244447 RepID=A0A3P8V168_CYNSE|nr:ubiquitin carboxyl-terminal hydrolase 47-like isoform X2 [Cynoglossus semilaevis]